MELEWPWHRHSSERTTWSKTCVRDSPRGSTDINLKDDRMTPAFSLVSMSDVRSLHRWWKSERVWRECLFATRFPSAPFVLTRFPFLLPLVKDHNCFLLPRPLTWVRTKTSRGNNSYLSGCKCLGLDSKYVFTALPLSAPRFMQKRYDHVGLTLFIGRDLQSISAHRGNCQTNPYLNEFFPSGLCIYRAALSHAAHAPLHPAVGCSSVVDELLVHIYLCIVL